MALCFVLLSRRGLSFQPMRLPVRRSTITMNNYASADIETLKVRDIKAELKDMGVSFSDCFDRESMVCRLREARDRKAPTTPSKKVSDSTPTQSPRVELPDKEEVFSELRSKSLKDLKLECSRRSLRYATFLEKEDFVKAIWKDMEEVLGFSVTGALRPGKSSEISGEQLDQEMTNSDTPILLDVFATWCGPCKLMAPELDKVASEFGKRVRVAKLDSDQHPAWAGRFKVAGLPTILVIQDGEVKERLEGAVMKDRLMELVQPYVN